MGRPLHMLLVPRQEPRACTAALWAQRVGVDRAVFNIELGELSGVGVAPYKMYERE